MQFLLEMSLIKVKIDLVFYKRPLSVKWNRNLSMLYSPIQTVVKYHTFEGLSAFLHGFFIHIYSVG